MKRKQPGRFNLSLEGRFRPGIELQFYGMFAGCASIPSICTQFAHRLSRELGRAFAIHSYNGGEFFDPELLDIAHVDHEAPVGIFYGFPSEIAPVFFEHPIRIGGFVCETDRIDPAWVAVCNELHLVIVPSTFCQRVFRDSGVTTPVMVVPHGLEPEYRPFGEKERTTPLVFYNTCFASSHLDRKSIEELVRSFLRAFGPSGDDCVLRLRTQLSRELAEIRLRHDFGKAIQLDPLVGEDVETFARMYSDVHCTVHPSKGEGFGLIPLQSIACETPVIAPAVTGMADYLDASNAMCLRTSGRTTGRAAGNQAGMYYTIDEDHLVELLRHARDQWDDEYVRVHRAGPNLRERYGWDRVLTDFVEVVRSALEAKNAETFSAQLGLALRSTGTSSEAHL